VASASEGKNNTGKQAIPYFGEAFLSTFASF
jgi:hypothetical protein